MKAEARTSAQRAQEVAQAAVDADRALMNQEFQLVREATHAEDTPPAIRGALRELGNELTRQEDARRERARVAAEQQQARLVQSKLEARHARWQALDPILAAVFHALDELPNDPALQALARHLGRTNRGKAPRTFEPQHLSELQRLGIAPLP
jgi:uncharacterized protein (UPF0147 family)